MAQASPPERVHDYTAPRRSAHHRSRFQERRSRSRAIFLATTISLLGSLAATLYVVLQSSNLDSTSPTNLNTQSHQSPQVVATHAHLLPALPSSRHAKGAALDGLVVDEMRLPVHGKSFVVSSATSPGHIMAYSDQYGRLWSDAPIPPGEWSLMPTASYRGVTSTSYTFTVLPDQAHVFVYISLPSFGRCDTIEGRIVDELSRPLPHIWVQHSLGPSAHPTGSWTDHNGTFSLTRLTTLSDFADDHALLWVPRQDSCESTPDYPVLWGSRGVVISARTPLPLALSVTDSLSGALVNRCRVYKMSHIDGTATQWEGLWTEPLIPDATGLFDLGRFHRGEHRLLVVPLDLAYMPTLSERITIGTNASNRCAVSVSPAVRRNIFVVNEMQRPEEGCTVEVIMPFGKNDIDIRDPAVSIAQLDKSSRALPCGILLYSSTTGKNGVAEVLTPHLHAVTLRIISDRHEPHVMRHVTPTEAGLYVQVRNGATLSGRITVNSGDDLRHQPGRDLPASRPWAIAPTQPSALAPSKVTLGLLSSLNADEIHSVQVPIASNGEWGVKGLDSGTWTVSLLYSAEPQNDDTGFHSYFKERIAVLTLAQGEVRVLNWRGTGLPRAQLQVVVRMDGNPISGTTLKLTSLGVGEVPYSNDRRASGQLDVVTDEKGTLRFVGPPGEWVMRAYVPRLSDSVLVERVIGSLHGHPKPGSVVEYERRLLRFRLRSANGKLMTENVAVQVTEYGQRISCDGPDANGWFVCDPMPVVPFEVILVQSDLRNPRDARELHMGKYSPYLGARAPEIELVVPK